jgi:ferredoxin/coenzyme F420-reducing hydrogenase delta subunit
MSGAKRRLEKDQPPGEMKTLDFHCNPAQNQNGDSLGLPCLGRITASTILAAALIGFDEVVLTRGICSRCHLQAGEELLTSSMATSRRLLESTGFGQVAIRIRQEERTKEPILGRREIFSRISNKVKDKAASFLSAGETAVREELTRHSEGTEDKPVSTEREWLRKLLRQNRQGDPMVVKYRPDLPWGRIEIDEENCSACGICVALCPTGAISRKSANGEEALYFNSSTCTNCSLCKEACPENVIDFEEDLSLTDILDDEARVVARVKSVLCNTCGERITAGKGSRCPTCEKRQVWAVNVKYTSV